MTVARGVSSSSAEHSTASTTAPLRPLPPPPSLRLRLVNEHVRPRLHKLKKVFFNYMKFVGPGFMISVAYSTSFLLPRCHHTLFPSCLTRCS